jgi:hypothetical protein
MPHSKKDVKMDRKDKLGEIIPEVDGLCMVVERGLIPSFG